MEYFHLEHPSDEVFLCDHNGCDGIADYLEVEGTQEVLRCSVHTTSHTYAARLPVRLPTPSIPHRSKPLM